MNLNENRAKLTHERVGREDKERTNDAITFIKPIY